MSAKKTLLNRLAEDDLQKVFQGLFFLASKYKDEQLRNDTTIQSNRLKDLEKQRLNETNLQKESDLQKNKISQGLLKIIKDLSDDNTLDGEENVNARATSIVKTSWKRNTAYFAAAIGVLAGIAELSGYNLKDAFTRNNASETPTEIQVLAPNASTTGINSPATITDDGNVNISYGEPRTKIDSISPPENQ